MKTNECYLILIELKRIYNSTVESVGALASLGCPIDQWDVILVFNMVKLLDSQSRKDWETSPTTSEQSTFEELKQFVQSRVRALEAVESSCKPSQIKPSNHQPSHPRKVTSLTISNKESKPSKYSCVLCKKPHYIAFCCSFQEKPVSERREFVRTQNLCYNCLGNHKIHSCLSKKVCRSCQGRHHSLLHSEETTDSSNSDSDTTAAQQPVVPVTSHLSSQQSSVLLATATVIVTSPSTGSRYYVRALIDQGSEVSFVTESLAQTLCLKRSSATLPVVGIGSAPAATSRGLVNLHIFSRYDVSNKIEMKAYILPRLTSYVSKLQLKNINTRWPHLDGLQFADSEMPASRSIDILIGADVYPLIIMEDLCKGPVGAPIAQQTLLGWIVSGNTSPSLDDAATSCLTSLQCSLDHQLISVLQNFWKQEEVSAPEKPRLTEAESNCERHFVTTHRRNTDGSYVVRLPFADDPSVLGKSYETAEAMVVKLNSRFIKQPQLKQDYTKFLAEYERLGHMEKVVDTRHQGYYLPHHGVYRHTSSTTKLRVVFNGSQKTSTGVSLNDILHVGPQLLPPLFDILLRWRMHCVVFSGDIEKMYRQVKLHQQDQTYQQILWIDDNNQVTRYKLKTVTYGLACSPYLAIRTLHQLAEDEAKTYPVGSQVLLNDVYVDDVMMTYTWLCTNNNRYPTSSRLEGFHCES